MKTTKEQINTNGSLKAPHSRFYQMDIARYYLALSVIIAHFNIVFDKDVFWPTDSGTAVGVFFGFSGFLVYASYLRHNSLKGYIVSRAKRILPAYSIVIVSSALLLSFVSSYDAVSYYLSTDFWKYLAANLTFMNFLHPDLPGVFTGHNVSAVNGSLWTLKVEWGLYLSIPFFVYVLKRYRVNFLVAVATLFGISLLYNSIMNYCYTLTGTELYYRLSYQFAGNFTYFYTGVCLYKYKDFLTKNKLLFLCLGITLIAIHYIMMSIISDKTVTQIISFILYPIATVTFFLAISVAKLISEKITIIGNCSYEMYLFHFPILQCLACSETFCSLPVYVMLGISIAIIYIISFIVNRY